MENLLQYLSDTSNLNKFIENYEAASIISNLAVSILCASLMLFMIKTETAPKERPWTIYIGLAFLIISIQYLLLGFLLPAIKYDSGTNPIIIIVTDLFGITISLFFLAAARTLLNKKSLIPRWFLILVLIDLTVTVLFSTNASYSQSPEPVPTIYRLLSNSIIAFSLAQLGRAAYINTKFYGRSFGGFWGLSLMIIYAGIQIVSQLIPNFIHYTPQLRVLDAGSKEAIEQTIGIYLTFIAVLLKMSLFVFAFLITTLENQTLIKLRKKLRESVNERKVFFSRKGILEAIYQSFDKKGIKLYVKVPPERKTDEEKQAHVYSYPSNSPNEYECVSVAETPLPKLLKRLSQKQAETKQIHQKGNFFSRIFQNDNVYQNEFDGIVPVLYHGALIGCFTIEKKTHKDFTYSAREMCRVLSEDISVLLEFYRVQISLKVFNDEFNKLEVHLDKDSVNLTFDTLNRKFENIIQQVCSPIKTLFITDVGFVKAQLHRDINTGDLLELCKDSKKLPNGNKPVKYDCIVSEKNKQLNIGWIFLEYEIEKDPLSKPSLGYFDAYRDAVGSVITKSFLSSVERKLNLTIRKLNLELTKKQTFNSWFDEIAKSLKEAELGGVILFHPETQDFWQSKKSGKTGENKYLEEVLANAFPEPKVILNQLNGSKPTVFSLSDNLIIGLKLPLISEDEDIHPNQREAALFIEVKRVKFAYEVEFDLPWSRFLTNFSRVAGKALSRIIFAKKLQKHQAERFENYKILSTATQIGFVTHNLINIIESLGDGARLLNFAVEELDIDESMKKVIELRIEEIRKKFDELQSLTQGLRNIATISSQSGSCSLLKSIQEAIKLNEAKLEGHIELELEGTQNETAVINSSQIICDIEVNLPSSIVELTFNSLIKNSIDAIKCKDNNDYNGAGKPNRKALIKIWLELEEGSTFVSCFIKDTGFGVNPDIREKIFDMNVSTKVGNGGWGLFYTKKILDMNAGSIELLHSEPGDTVFCVKLPIL